MTDVKILDVHDTQPDATHKEKLINYFFPLELNI
jgi:hypothetical protein